MPFGSARVQNGELIQCEADVLRQEMHGFALRATNDVNGRATAAFDAIAASVIPDLVRQPPDHPLRVSVPGCRTGEEAMLFLEQMTTGERIIRLQVFASDIDADCMATARPSVHSDSIASEVSAARLARITEHERGYQAGRYYRSEPAVGPILKSLILSEGC